MNEVTTESDSYIQSYLTPGCRGDSRAERTINFILRMKEPHECLFSKCLDIVCHDKREWARVPCSNDRPELASALRRASIRNIPTAKKQNELISMSPNEEAQDGFGAVQRGICNLVLVLDAGWTYDMTTVAGMGTVLFSHSHWLFCPQGRRPACLERPAYLERPATVGLRDKKVEWP